MKQTWLKFYPADWRADPALRMCSLAARGLWMEMLCIMHDAEPYGSLLINGTAINEQQLARICGQPLREIQKLLAELEQAGVFSRDNDIIYSRRMRRDREKAETDKANGGKGGHPEIRRGAVPKDQRVRRFRRSDAPAKAQRIFDRSAGCCHWCQKTLDPQHYHIDHLIAVRDGGGNEESNLVASCPDCNGERAMTWGRNDADLMVGNSSDHKAQKLEARSQIPEAEAEKKETRASGALARRSDWPPDFAEQFWQQYPHKIGKAAALKTLEKLARAGPVGFAELMAALHRYAAKTDDRPWCNPATWLNQQRWLDQPAAFQPNGNPNGVPRKRTVIDAADDLIAKLHALDRPAETGSVAGSPPARLLPPD